MRRLKAEDGVMEYDGFECSHGRSGYYADADTSCLTQNTLDNRLHSQRSEPIFLCLDLGNGVDMLQ